MHERTKQVNKRILLILVGAFSALAFILVLAPGKSLALPAPEVSILYRDGTLHPASSYQPAVAGPEYSANPPVYSPGDLYARDEVVIRFRPNVPPDQQNALMAAHSMRFGRPIYGDTAFVAKVPVGTAMTVANALRNNPLLEI